VRRSCAAGQRSDGTQGSNPVPSSEESANYRSLQPPRSRAPSAREHDHRYHTPVRSQCTSNFCSCRLECVLTAVLWPILSRSSPFAPTGRNSSCFTACSTNARDNVKQTRITRTALIFGVTGARHRCRAGESGLCTGNHHLLRTLTPDNFSPVSGP
jgi:hypothetical protein